VRDQEIAVFRKHTRGAGHSLGVHNVTGENAVLRDKSTAHSFIKQGEPDGAIFVSDFPLDTTQEELSEALGSLGMYERLVMRTFFIFLFRAGLSDPTHRPRLKICIFHVSERRCRQAHIACSPSRAYHHPGANSTYRTHPAPPVHLVTWAVGESCRVWQTA
jgi:hypothetical protein